MILRSSISALGLSLVVGSSALAAGPTGDAARGHQLFDAVGCYECHGHVGQGGSAGPRIAPNPPSLAGLASAVRNPAKEMPPYSPKVLSAQDIIDIHAYLASIPPSPAAGKLKLLAMPGDERQP